MTHTQATAAPSQRSTSPLAWVLTAVVVVGLAIDAVVHVRLAPNYELAFPGGIGGGTLFYFQAGLAAVAAAAVLLWRRWPSYVFAFLVAASAFAAVVLSRYVELPAVGPIPAMYEPLWFFEKALSAVAEGAAALAALILAVVSRRRR